MKNMKIITFVVAVAVCSGGVLAESLEENFENTFKKKYRQEILPELSLSKTDRYKAKGMSESEINSELAKLADKAADCQFRTFEAYDEKFQAVAFNAIKKGKSTEEASIDLNEALRSAVSRGEISQRDFNKRIKTAMNIYGVCVVKNGLVSK